MLRVAAIYAGTTHLLFIPLVIVAAASGAILLALVIIIAFLLFQFSPEGWRSNQFAELKFCPQ